MTPRRLMACFALAGAFLSLPACSTTRIVSVIAPDAEGRRVHRLLIVPLFGDPARERAAEEAYARAFQGRSLEVLRASEVLPAGIDEAAFYTLMVRNGVDGVLVLRPGRSGAVPGSVDDYHAGRENLDAHPYGCNGKLLSRESAEPGDPLDEKELAKPWLEMTVTILDASSRKAVWSARSKTQGAQGTPFVQLIRAQAGEAVARMAQDGILGAAEALNGPGARNGE